MRGENAVELLTYFTEKLDAASARCRGMSVKNQTTRDQTVSALLANLVAGAVNKVNPDRFLALSFNRNDYTGTGLGLGVMTAMRVLLKAEGLVSAKRGYYRHHHMPGFDRSSLTRLRPTTALRNIFRRCGVDYRSVISPKASLIRLNRPNEGVGVEDTAISLSRSTLELVNALLAQAEILLPDDAWEAEATDQTPDNEMTYAERRHRQYADVIGNTRETKPQLLCTACSQAIGAGAGGSTADGGSTQKNASKGYNH